MNSRFAGKVALVTGGGTGVGRAAARAFADEGASVVVAGRDTEQLDQTVELIAADGGKALAVSTDVTQEDQVANLVAETVEHHGRLDVAFNNAGVIAMGVVDELDAETWRNVVDINLTGVWLSMKHEIRAMRDRGGGTIVNMGSNLGAHLALPGTGAYGAAKAGVSALTRTAAREAIEHGIRINVISPGFIDAPMSLAPGETPEDRHERAKDAVPLGRVASLDEVTSAVLWLAAEESGSVVGHDLVIDGGTTT
jgi:NAD(P)-dependent dehydrogenase (short-subunit alcohol dehydrogenase family)